jgi:hypothetical protein
MELWSNDTNREKTDVLRGKIYTNATLSSINPTWIGRGSKLGLCSNRVANNHLKTITVS